MGLFGVDNFIGAPISFQVPRSAGSTRNATRHACSRIAPLRRLNSMAVKTRLFPEADVRGLCSGTPSSRCHFAAFFGATLPCLSRFSLCCAFFAHSLPRRRFTETPYNIVQACSKSCSRNCNYCFVGLPVSTNSFSRSNCSRSMLSTAGAILSNPPTMNPPTLYES